MRHLFLYLLIIVPLKKLKSVSRAASSCEHNNACSSSVVVKSVSVKNVNSNFTVSTLYSCHYWQRKLWDTMRDPTHCADIVAHVTSSSQLFKSTVASATLSPFSTVAVFVAINIIPLLLTLAVKKTATHM